MAKVLLAWELGAGAGHCVKLAPIAAGLRARGHFVSVAARDLVTARRVLGSTDITYFQAPYLCGRIPTPVREAHSLAHILHNTGFSDEVALESLCAAWHSIFEAVKPDAIICDHAPMALSASRCRDVRRVVIGTGFTVPPATAPFPDFRYWLPDSATDNGLGHDEDALLKRVNEYLSRCGAEPLGTLADLYAEVDASFLLTFRELDHYPGRMHAEYFGTWTPQGGVVPEWPKGSPRVFAYLKPPAANWRLNEFLEFLRESQLAILAYVDGGESEWLNKFQSPQLRFLNAPVNIPAIASDCDLAILNGNAGSVTAFLLAGVPQLNLPLYAEQIILSRRVADFGAGLYANPARPQQMAARLMTVLSDGSYRGAAERFARRYADFDGRSAAEDIVARIHALLAE